MRSGAFQSRHCLPSSTLSGRGQLPFLETLASARLSNGWAVVCAQEFVQFEPDRAGELFPEHEVVAGQMMESATLADVRGFDRRRQVWRVAHHTLSEEMEVAVEGSVPDAFGAIAVEWKRRQARGRKGVDFLFEIPLELAVAVTGFRPDHGGAPIDTIFEVVEKRLSGKAGEQQRERIDFNRGLTSAVRQTLVARAAHLGFGSIGQHPDLHRFYKFGATNVFVRERADVLEVIEFYWGTALGRPYVEIQFVARRKVKPRLARPGLAAFPRPKETLRTMFFGPPKIDPEGAIAAAISTGCTLLAAVDAYFTSGVVVPPLQAPVYFNSMEA